jgi:predicted PolB exonuclease-like 3'-5' exonuclease|tara:strand:+ start:5069 stop:5905 length:837 start_codon:yes stop_codon:yes gene_type:complete
MQHRNLFVFDIETVPDTDAVPALTGFDDPDIQARRDELSRYHLEITDGRNDFHRQPFHRVVAISFLEAEIEHTPSGGEIYHLKELRSGGEASFGEKKLLQGFFGYFERLRPRLVSFNGRGFDLPVLKYRAMAHGVQAALLHDTSNKWENYTARYALDWHCDLIEALSDFGASARIKLNEVCAILGLPGKFGVDGSQVAPMFDDGRVAEIRDYCETDVLNTYLVYLRWQHHRGVLSTEALNKALADVISLVDAEGEARPHLKQFIEAWGEASGNKFLMD